MPDDTPSHESDEPDDLDEPEAAGAEVPQGGLSDGNAAASGALSTFEAAEPRRLKWDLVDAAAVVCYEAGAVGASAWVGRLIGGLIGGGARTWTGQLVYVLVWCAMVLPVVPLVAKRWWGARPAELGIARPREGSLGWFVKFALAVAAAYLVLGVALAASVRLGLLEFRVSMPAALHEIGRQGGVFTMLLAFLVAAPVTEELVFRGVLYPALREKLGVGWAVLASAAIFAAMHLLWAGKLFPPVTQLLGGLIFAWSYERTRSLVYPVVFHMIGNVGIAAWILVSAYRPFWISSLLGCQVHLFSF